MKTPMLAIAPTVFAEDSKMEATVPRLATTAQGHNAVAGYFIARAADASAEAERHRSMAQKYAESRFARKAILQGHCERLVSEYESLTILYQRMANEHEQMAKDFPAVPAASSGYASRMKTSSLTRGLKKLR